MGEADGIDDAVDGAMRTGLMVAARIGEQLARMREEEQRTIAAAEERRAGQLQERFVAQRAAARAQLAPTTQDDWWDKATPTMIERAHETATAWKAYDPEAALASERIRDQVQARYGIDVNNTGADELAVSAALHHAQQARVEVDFERTKSSAARTEEAVVGAAMAGANRQDRDAARSARMGPAYDSPERRRQLTEILEGKGDREAVNSRLLADKHQGTPALAAVTQKPSLAKPSKMTKQGGQGKTLERGGLER
jgi:colicin import membrane protein